MANLTFKLTLITNDTSVKLGKVKQVVGSVVSTMNGYLMPFWMPRQSAILAKVAFGDMPVTFIHPVLLGLKNLFVPIQFLPPLLLRSCFAVI